MPTRIVAPMQTQPLGPRCEGCCGLVWATEAAERERWDYFRGQGAMFLLRLSRVRLWASGRLGERQFKTKSETKLQKQICQVVLDHFEKQYSKELGESWNSVREVLIAPQCWQYAVLLNKFSISSKVEDNLHLKGYHLLFPEISSFKCYICSTPGRFPAQKHRAGRLKEYYLLNAASLLAVLALEVENGENILDMCAAPGGKSIATLQCAWPGLLLSNEYDNLRSHWLKQTLESFIPESVMNIVILSQRDGRQIGNLQPESFDKVLVDAPCSNDRSWLFSSDIQQATLRLAQRKLLSAVQIQLLRSAIKALRPGGYLVYSTCTLSKAENSDVITYILNSCSNVQPVDMGPLASSASQEFTFASGVQPHELLVLPERGKAWGPMYISKLKKI
ncbi:tRNA (cytosine(34)-C(5))-methyltransferase, mitochondrial-like [Sceloporus undulatus]|uniref:tRNA (cytosine(34)-C(5))-methyltransferase, mitochondrial-like n=1 Tax=Sceloporus undulatus TaxID=8520 RepID=UPI001C4D344B|nr:tRNA (cytosine(34)-C(5))-methyltransferase, mitochondrial-like [Sceloporus undulatus]